MQITGFKPQKPMQLKLRISHESAFAVFLGLIWANHTLVKYFRAILIRVPYIGDFREYIVTFIFGVVLVMALPYMAKRIHPMLILGYLSIGTIYALNFFIYPENQAALEENMIAFLIKSLPLVFVGASVDLKKHYKMLYYISVASVILRFIQLLLEPTNVTGGDMYSSYLLLPHVCMVIAAALADMRIADLLVSAIGIFSIISFGTRGPLLCVFSLVLFYMILFQKIHKHRGFFILIVLAIIGMALFYEEIMQVLFSLVRSMGMSTRVFDMIFSGDIMDMTGRDIIRAKLMADVSENWFGYGIAADRTMIGTYAHNLLIEFWVSYGVFVGTICFLIPVLATVRLLIQKSRNNRREDSFILVLIASSFVKLFLSGSYLTESFLFLLIGIIVAEYRLQNIENK